MQPWGNASSIPGANTLFEGRQIKRSRRQKDRRDTEINTQRRDLKIDHRTDNRRDQRTAPRHNVRGS
jgi:hypothetical protein